MEQNIKLIIIGIVLLLVWIMNSYQPSLLEHASSVSNSIPLSNEAIQNLGSVYNKSQITVSNIDASGNANVTGNMSIGGTVTSTGNVFAPNYVLTPGSNAGVFAGPGDGDTFSTYNVGVKSWWGIGFPTSCVQDGCSNLKLASNGVKNGIVFDTRSGSAKFAGSVQANTGFSADPNVTSPAGRIVGAQMSGICACSGNDLLRYNGVTGQGNQSNVAACTQYCVNNYPQTNATQFDPNITSGNGLQNCWCKWSNCLQNNSTYQGHVVM